MLWSHNHALLFIFLIHFEKVKKTDSFHELPYRCEHEQTVIIIMVFKKIARNVKK